MLVAATKEYKANDAMRQYVCNGSESESRYCILENSEIVACISFQHAGGSQFIITDLRAISDKLAGKAVSGLLSQVLYKHRVITQVICSDDELFEQLGFQRVEQGYCRTVEISTIHSHDSGFGAYAELRRRVYVEELGQMTNEEHSRVNNDADLYEFTLNGNIIGGCRFLSVADRETKIDNGLSIDENYVLMGKIFIASQHRNAQFCTYMLRHCLGQYSGQKITILSYAHLEKYYSQFGFAAIKWFIPDLCMIMESDNK